MLKRFNELVEKLQATNGRLDKEAILNTYKDDEEVKEILNFIFNPYVLTGISDKKYKKGLTKNYMYTQDIKELDFKTEILDYYKNNKTGRDEDVAQLLYFINYMGYANLVSSIVKKDLKLGIQASTLNKVFGKGFVPEFEVMLAHNIKDHPDFLKGKEIIVTEKLDGTRGVLMYDDGKWSIKSRNGLEHYGLVEILEEAEHLNKDYVYDGELVLPNPNNIPAEDLFRLSQSFVSSEKEDNKRGINFQVFDRITLEGFKEGKYEVSTIDRKRAVEQELNSLHIENKSIHIIPVDMLYIGNDYSKVEEIFNEMIEQEKEGVMVNEASAIWENKRVKTMLKVKAEETADVLVKAVYKGSAGTKNEHRLGGVTIEFIGPDGNHYESNCGSGFRDKNGEFGNDRQILWDKPELIVGKIVEVKYTNISKNKDDDTLCMRFPRFKRIRNDKTEISMS